MTVIRRGPRRTRFGFAFLALGAVPVGMALAEGGEQSTPGSAVVSRTNGPSVDAAVGLLKSAENARAQTRAMADQAEAEGDALLLRCVRDKLDQMDTLVAQAQKRAVALGTSQDAGQVDLNFAVLSVVSQKVTVLLREAGDCVGADEASATTNDRIVVVQSKGATRASLIPPSGLLVPIAPPFAAPTTDFAPGTDMPGEPTPASPTF